MIKFDIINKQQDILEFFVTFKKCSPSKIKRKDFPAN